MSKRQIATQQDYRIGAVFALGARQPLKRAVIEKTLVDFAGLPAEKATLLAGHWFTTLPFKTIRKTA